MFHVGHPVAGRNPPIGGAGKPGKKNHAPYQTRDETARPIATGATCCPADMVMQARFGDLVGDTRYSVTEPHMKSGMPWRKFCLQLVPDARQLIMRKYRHCLVWNTARALKADTCARPPHDPERQGRTHVCALESEVIIHFQEAVFIRIVRGGRQGGFEGRRDTDIVSGGGENHDFTSNRKRV